MARPRSDIRERLLKTARAHFLAHGVEGASLRDIAARARTSIGMVYYYFPTKEALFEAVIDEAFPSFVKGFEEALQDDVPIPARIERLFVRMGNLTNDEADVLRIVLAEVLRSKARRGLVVRLGMRGHLPAMIRTIAEGMASGELRASEPPMAMALAVFAPALMAQLLRRLVGDSAPKELDVPVGEDLARSLARLTLDGIRAPTKRASRTRR